MPERKEKGSRRLFPVPLGAQTGLLRDYRSARSTRRGEERERERRGRALESEEDFHGERTRYPSREDATIREAASAFPAKEIEARRRVCV